MRGQTMVRNLLSTLALCQMLAIGFVSGMTSMAEADGVSDEPERIITRQVLELRRPVARIYAGTPEAIMAFDEQRTEFLFIDAATGEIADTQQIDGAPVYFGSRYISPERWDFLFIHENRPGEYPRYNLGIALSKRENYFSSAESFPIIPVDFLKPAANYSYGLSNGGYNIIIWDRSLNSQKMSYTIGGLRKRMEVFAKLYPYDLVDFGNDQYILSINPSRSEASLFNIQEGYSEDTAFLKGISIDDPAHYSSFTPNAAYGGNGTIVIANGESELLTVLAVIPGIIPQIDRPMQISLKSLRALASGNRNVLVAANKDLSVILVGTVGGSQLAVYRRVGGALEELKPIDLGSPIIDMVVLPTARPSGGSEVFAFLRSDRRTLQIEPDIAALLDSGPIYSPDPGELAFPTSDLDRVAVFRLQRALTSLGFSVGSIDGMPGPLTASAIRTFQFKNGLDVTGLLDQGTQDALNRAVKQMTQEDRMFIFAPEL